MPSANMPMSNRQHPVPQNIMDVEFKLIGELTMRQFSYLLVFGLAAYFSANSIPGIMKFPAIIFFVLLALGLAFIPVGERGLDEWIMNFYKSIMSPTQRKWRKEPQLPTAFMYDNLAIVQHEMITLAPTSSRRKLEEYLRFKSDENSDDPLDIPEKSYVMKLKEVYRNIESLDVPSYGASVGVMVEEPVLDETVDSTELGLQIPESVPQVEDVTTTTQSVSDNVLEPMLAVQDLQGPKNIQDIKTTEVIKETKSEGIKKSVVTESAAPTILHKSRSVYGKSDYKGLRDRVRTEDASSVSDLEQFSFTSVTPDMHSGRKFTNLVPSEGQIILPIRGERVLTSSYDSSIDDDIQNKAKQLEELLQKISAEEGVVIKKPVSKAPVSVDKEAEEMAEKLRKQNEDLASEINRLKEQIKKGKSMSVETNDQEQLLRKLESQKGDIASSYSELREQVKELQRKLDEKVKVSTGEEFVNKMRNQLPVLTDRPNVLTGVVRDAEGKFLSDTLVIVKNSRGDTVRALKTNSLGQFTVSTPLQNGTYTVEVSPFNKTNLTFAIIPIEIKGEVISTLDVVGK